MLLLVVFCGGCYYFWCEDGRELVVGWTFGVGVVRNLKIPDISSNLISRCSTTSKRMENTAQAGRVLE